MKKLYERLELEIIIFRNEDMITTSPIPSEEYETEKLSGQS